MLKVLVFCLFVQISESCTWEFWDTFLPSAVEAAVMNIPHLTHGQVVVSFRSNLFGIELHDVASKDTVYSVQANS